MRPAVVFRSIVRVSVGLPGQKKKFPSAGAKMRRESVDFRVEIVYHYRAIGEVSK